MPENQKNKDKREWELEIATALLHCSGSYTAVSCEGCPRENMYDDPIECMESCMKMAANIIKKRGVENGRTVPELSGSATELPHDL